MTTLQVIIERSYKETQICAYNVSPTQDQLDAALPLLQGILERRTRPPILTCWLGQTNELKSQRGAIFRNFTQFAGQYALPQDIYLNCLLDTAQIVRLAPSPGDGARQVFLDTSQSFATSPLTLLGNGNRIDGGSDYILSTNGQTLSLLYREDLAEWLVLPAEYGLSQNLPYPAQFDDLFVIELALRLDPRYGKELSEITANTYQELSSHFKGRYFMLNSSANPDILWSSNFVGSTWAQGNMGWS